MSKPKRNSPAPTLSVEDVSRLSRTPDRKIRASLLGVGGVGINILETVSHIHSGLAETKFVIYDHDTVEFHNLNRTTAFKLSDLGQEKVRVARNHYSCVYGFYNSRVTETFSPQGLIIDARDTLDPSQLLPNTWIKLAYDGGSNISFTWHPKIVASRLLTLDDGNSYAVVPSFFVPAALLGVLTLRFLEFPVIAKIPEANAGTIHLDIDQMVHSISHKWKDIK